MLLLLAFYAPHSKYSYKIASQLPSCFVLDWDIVQFVGKTHQKPKAVPREADLMGY